MSLKNLLFIFLTFKTITSLSQPDNDSIQRVKLIKILTENKKEITVYYKKSVIPKILKRELSLLNEEKFKIVNPHKKYRKTDLVRNPFLPNKQLVFVANYNQFWLLFYHQGGRGLQTHCILAEIIDKEVVYIEDLYVNSNIEEFEQLLDKLNKSSYRVSNLW